MSNNNEKYRLRNFRNGEIPSTLYSTLIFEYIEENCVDKAISVLELILEPESNYWPNDDYWLQVLPEWLLKTFKIYTPAELSLILSDRSNWNNIPWTFGSWLDRIKDRDWQWWSLDRKDGKIIIYISIAGYPSSTKALEHLIVAAGGRLLQTE